jgi:thioredoxin-like negative regulator of GroEL
MPHTRHSLTHKQGVDETHALAQRFDIQGVPTLLLVKNGEVIDTIIGLTPANELKTRLQSVVQSKTAGMPQPPDL